MKPVLLVLGLLGLLLCVSEIGPARAHEGPVTALVHVNLVPMHEEAVIPDQTVLVRDGRIAAFGPAREIAVPEGATRISGEGRYLLPGLADMHMHVHQNWLSAEWPVSPLHLYLANGVTAIRCFGPEGRSPESVLFLREAVENRRLAGPRIFSCGPQLRHRVAEPEQAVRRQRRAGFDFVKLYSFLTKEEFRRALAEANSLRMYTAGHLPFQVGLDGALAEGMNEIAHVEELFWEVVDFDRQRYFDREDAWMSYVVRTAFRQLEPLLEATNARIQDAFSEPMDRMAEKIRNADVPVCTTLFLDEVIVEKLFEPKAFLARPASRYLPRSYVERFERGREKHQVQFRGGEVFAPFKRRADLMLLKHLKDADVDLVLGTDAGTGGMGLVPGASVHDELRGLVRNGFSPYEAIRAATASAGSVAERMTGQGDFGTIRVGNRADLILTRENPLEAVEHLARPLGVMAAGRWYSKTDLAGLLEPGLPLTAAVHHVCESDGRHRTYMDVVVGKAFRGALPEDVRSITVTGPGGKMALQKGDFRYLPGLRDFWIALSGAPVRGLYTFEVVGRDRRGLAADFQVETRTLAAPDPSGLFPAGGAVLSTSAPTFRWNAVEGEGPVFYRLDVHEPRGGRVYATGYRRDMLSHTVPAGTLSPGRPYRWRVRLADSDHWTSVQNRTNSPWRLFTLKPSAD